ncbi:MAG: hypothetical protein U0791_23355 [Gemmataceae bacterium]
MTATAPLVCKPLGTLPLAEVHAFPPAAARDLEKDGVRTLFDLQPHVEQNGNDVDAVRKAFASLGVRKEHLDQCTWSILRHLNPATVPPIAKPKPERKPRKKKADHGEGEGTTIAAADSPARASSEADAPTPSPADPANPRTTPDDFDENTPPPRVRPQGEAVPHFLKVPAGESVIALFFEWDKAGRIPAGSVLCEFQGSEFGTRPSHRVTATTWPPPLGEPGDEIPDEKLDAFRVRVSIDQRAKRGETPVKHVVMSPTQEAR